MVSKIFLFLICPKLINVKSNLIIWIILITLLLDTKLVESGKDLTMNSIILIPIAKIDSNILTYLKNSLERKFGKKVIIGKEVPLPIYAYNKKRDQYHSTTILYKIAEEYKNSDYERILAIIDYDLYVPELNFVFGQAMKKFAIISLTRLRQDYYGMEKDDELFRQRILKEAVHELGHTYGLSHCKNFNCVMYFSNSLMDTDRKNSEFCESCRKKLIPILK